MAKEEFTRRNLYTYVPSEHSVETHEATFDRIVRSFYVHPCSMTEEGHGLLKCKLRTLT